MLRPIVFLVTLAVHTLRTVFRTREELLIENLALRQQVITLKKKRPRPQLDDMDRAFWVALRTAWPGWTNRLIIVNPDTVTKWNRDRFRRYWAKISQHKTGSERPRIDAEIRRLIRTMARDGWGAPRIHSESLKLGFVVSEITVSRYLVHYPADPDQIRRWTAFLRNHNDAIAAMDFFSVPHSLADGVAERWIGSCRRELLAHGVVFGRRHLLRLMHCFIDYYHEDRCHLGL